jgi:hypothetical protein
MDAFPLLYDSATGKLASFLKQGGGPGEYEHPWIIAALPDDSLLIADRAFAHVVAPDLRISRTMRRQQLESVTPLRWPDNVMARTSPWDRRTRMGHTVLARYDFSGDTAAIIDTLLITEPNNGMGAAWVSGLRIVGKPFADGHVWVSDVNRYRLMQYSPAGVVLDSIERKLDWFPAGLGPQRVGEKERPHVVTNWVDDNGMLWVLLAQPRDDFADAWKDVARAPDGMIAEARVSALPAEYELKRSVIEVIDPATKKVIATHTFDGYIGMVLPDNRVGSFVETKDGIPILTIHRLSLENAGTN